MSINSENKIKTSTRRNSSISSFASLTTQLSTAAAQSLRMTDSQIEKIDCCDTSL
jgi:hypothetical protein